MGTLPELVTIVAIFWVQSVADSLLRKDLVKHLDCLIYCSFSIANGFDLLPIIAKAEKQCLKLPPCCGSVPERKSVNAL